MPSLRTLDPRFRPAAEAFFRWARQYVPGLVITSARRTRKEQERLYRLSQQGKNNGLPATPPGHSSHEVGLAFDMARPGQEPFTDEALQWLGAQWKLQGGTWWSGDPVHFAASPALLAARVTRHPRRRRASRR